MSNLKLNGMIVYCMLDKPVDCFDKEKGQEYKCGVVVDEDTADAFAEQFPKQAARKVKRSDFEGIYHVAPPEGAEKNLYVITLKKNSQITDKATGNKIPLPTKYRPRVLERQGNSLVDITFTVKPANSSYGTVSYEAGETRYGLIARLKNVLVTELIPYEKTNGGDYEVGDEFSDDEVPQAKPKATVPAKAPVKAKAKPQVDEDDSDSLPF